MKGTELKVPQEPLGIVIAGLPHPPQATVFSAYIWGPAPATTDDKGPKAA